MSTPPDSQPAAPNARIWLATATTPREYKRKKEVDVLRLRPHPKEFELYYDV